MTPPTTPAALEDYQWLVSDEARVWLARAASERASLVSLARSLHCALGRQRAHLVLQQAQLRVRAAEKFAFADGMFFRRRALEQATEQRIADYKASRLLGLFPAADLCCGIGGDLLSMAARGRVVGIERDPITALLAAANCRAAAVEEAQLQVGEAQEAPVQSLSAWHIDPDRRAAGRRTTRLDSCEPGLEVIDRLLAANRNGAVKLAPATAAPDHWVVAAELEWIGSRGECRQQVAWFGALARYPAKHAATVLSPESEPRTIVGEPQGSLATASEIGRWVYEPHAAVLAARLTAALATEYQLAAVAPGIVYLTADRAVQDPALSGFEVTDVLPFDLRKLRSLLRTRGIGRLEVKKRGVPGDPQRIRQALRVPGDESAVLLLARTGPRVTAILAKRANPGV